MKSKALLGAVLVALIVGYIELRLPQPVAAQGTDVVYQRLAVTDDARISDALSVGGTAKVGVLEFGTALTPIMTARLAASGTASDSTYVRGDGTWDDPLEAFRGLIAAFNGPCPTDWDEVTALRGRMIVGLVDGGTLAGTEGTALTNLEARRGGTKHPGPTYRNSGSTALKRVTLNLTSSNSGSVGLTSFTSLYTSDIWISRNSSIVISGSINQKLPAPYVQFRYCEYQP